MHGRCQFGHMTAYESSELYKLISWHYMQSNSLARFTIILRNIQPWNITQNIYRALVCRRSLNCMNMGYPTLPQAMKILNSSVSHKRFERQYEFSSMNLQTHFSMIYFVIQLSTNFWKINDQFWKYLGRIVWCILMCMNMWQEI